MVIERTERGFGKYFLLGIILILVILSYKITEPYLIVLISAFIFAYLVKPLFVYLNNKMPDFLAATFCILIIIFIFLIPTSLLIANVSLQAHSSFNSSYINNFIGDISSSKIIKDLNIDFTKFFDKTADTFISILGSAISYIPSLLISFVIFLFALYYILIDWDRVKKTLSQFIPFDKKERIIEDISHSTNGIIYGYLLVALIEFVVSAICFYFSGVGYYFLLAFLIAILVFIPGLGAVAVIVPMLTYYAIAGNWFTFVGVLITGLIVGIYIEIVLTAKILAGKSRIHPMIMLLGIIGGTSVFGIFGFIIGPLILVYTLKILKGIAREM
jgi:predicted PurR-regulated permease PerM